MKQDLGLELDIFCCCCVCYIKTNHFQLCCLQMQTCFPIILGLKVENLPHPCCLRFSVVYVLTDGYYH